ELAPERDLHGLPLVQVLLVVQNAPRGGLTLPGLDLDARELSTGTSKFELSFLFTPGAEGLAGVVEFDRDRFDGATVERLAG
ncbi:MAG TPA: hypothetical protein DD490_22815, partial [Acidobacteria bacterium]|nr:hypothetical protein [Acidobacteriota bacterium]